MNCLTILIKIKEYSYKKGEIPFNNFICVFKNNEFEGRISLTQYKYQFINHEIRDINSDINYKINLIDFITNKLIGSCEYCISYNKIKNLNIGSSVNFSNKVTLLINYKSQKDLLYLTLSSEIIKYNKIPFTINRNSENKNNINNINTNNIIIYNHNKLNQNRIITKHINNKNKKNPFEYIKIKKFNTNRKNENNLNSDIENNINYMTSSRSYKKYKNNTNNKNRVEIIYKRDFASPRLLFTEDDKKNINLNMHNICVQNYYAITSSQPPININPIIEKEDNSKNKIYTKKNLNCNRLNSKKEKEIKNCNYFENNDFTKENEIKNNFKQIKIKRSLTNTNLNFNKNKKENIINNNLNDIIMINNFDILKKNRNQKNEKKKKEISKKFKNKTKDKDIISENYLEKYSDYKNNTNNMKGFEVLKNNNYHFLFDKKNKIINKNKKNNQLYTTKTYSSVDKIKNKIFKHNYNKIVKINNNIFRNSTIDSENKYSIIKKKPYVTSFSKYLNSLDNLNNNIFENSSSFFKKVNNKIYSLEKNKNIISPKNFTLRCNSNNNLYRKTYNSNNNLNMRIKNENLYDNNYHIFIEENNPSENNISDNNFLYQKNFIINEKDYKDKILNLIQNNNLINKKLKDLKKEYMNKIIKHFLFQEKYLHKLQAKNIIIQKKNINEMKKYIHVNINCQINNKIIQKINKIKEKEINIYKKIFNISINNNDKYEELATEVMYQENENKLVYLLLGLIRNIINYHGDITQIYNNNIYKKRHLFLLLINNGIAINNSKNFNIKLKKNNILNELNKKYKCKEIKEEIEEEKEDNEEDEMEENKLNISIIYKNDNNIIDKILINDFPIKYKNITDKKFEKLSSNEYIFNNEIKVFAFYKDDKVFLQNQNESLYDSLDNDYSLDEFILRYIKNKDKLNTKNNYLTPFHIKKNTKFFDSQIIKEGDNNLYDVLDRNGVKRKKIKKKNLCIEKYSRNHKINELELNQEDFKKKFLNEKILLTNESNKNDSNISKEDNYENISIEMKNEKK